MGPRAVVAPGLEEEQPDGSEGQQQAEGVLNPGEVREQRGSRGDEEAAQHDGAEDPPQQHAALLLRAEVEGAKK